MKYILRGLLVWVMLGVTAISAQETDTLVISVDNLLGDLTGEADASQWYFEAGNSTSILVTDEALVKPEGDAGDDWERPDVAEGQARLRFSLYPIDRLAGNGFDYVIGETTVMDVTTHMVDEHIEAMTEILEVEEMAEIEITQLALGDRDVAYYETMTLDEASTGGQYVLELDPLVYVRVTLEMVTGDADVETFMAEAAAIIETLDFDAAYEASDSAPEDGVYRGGGMRFTVADGQIQNLNYERMQCDFTVEELTIYPELNMSIFNSSSFLVSRDPLGVVGFVITFDGNQATAEINAPIMCSSFMMPGDASATLTRQP